MTSRAVHPVPVLHRHPFLSLLSGSYVLFVVWLTLSPQPINRERASLINRVLDGLHRRGYVDWLDFTRLEFLSNIALFVPIGVFLLLLLGFKRWWLAGLTASAMTMLIESAQTRIPGRVPDTRDIFANTVGGLIGIAIALILTLPDIRRRRRRARRASDRVPAR